MPKRAACWVPLRDRDAADDRRALGTAGKANAGIGVEAIDVPGDDPMAEPAGTTLRRGTPEAAAGAEPPAERTRRNGGSAVRVRYGAAGTRGHPVWIARSGGYRITDPGRT